MQRIILNTFFFKNIFRFSLTISLFVLIICYLNPSIAKEAKNHKNSKTGEVYYMKGEKYISIKGKKLSLSQMCKIDLNGDKFDDFVFLIQGWKVFVLLTNGQNQTNLHLIKDLGKFKPNLHCIKGDFVTETTVGRRKGRKFKVPTGTFFEIGWPESAAVAYYWENGSFKEVWTSG